MAGSFSRTNETQSGSGEARSLRAHYARHAIVAVLAMCYAPAVRADIEIRSPRTVRRAPSKMRTMLEGYLEKDRTLSDYRQTVTAYHKVYLISSQAEEVTPSLIAEAELYREMGQLYDRSIFSPRSTCTSSC